MKRREVIKQMFVMAGGILIASSCDFSGKKASITLHNVDFSADDEVLLGRLVDVIIPEDDSPGGKCLNLHLFVMKMLDDCASPEQQEAFTVGLKKCHRADKGDDAELLNYLKGLSDEDQFATILKARTLQGYLNSEYVMTNKLIYELVPGRYDGAVKINA
ncbi:gluconate 2-dehydrogenase subunit 3 family protein [Sphingobacterium sp. lm-10]|uniref:gluconate 2-dehydrogenase subunit 3 family protein n=1 Tax=Sphingobacterium sp. lm-10 TaxID=2944904 RepID=UPI00202202A9|nr:gluconate 2-dehydrogenase subunit 3 family protein [Sphingobacterium sp. lm-10]MCL7988072.1 gluconate 2-dehydrogenase subunit 3 family protein [Sphingobacterium sp. lm-10]